MTGDTRPARPRPVASQAPPELEMAFPGLRLVGTSVAARVTAFAVPELGVALDLGRLSPTLSEQPMVLLTHAHLDHLSGVLAYLNLRARFHPEPPPRMAVPVPSAGPLVDALRRMPGMEPLHRRLDIEEVVVPVAPGQEIAVPGGAARAFAADHGSAALGWSLRLPGEERPCLVFAGDGTVRPFQARPDLLDARVAVVECTFVEPNRMVAARLSGHAHLRDWVELAPGLRCDTLVLSHLPLMPADDLLALARPLAEALPGRLVLWAEGG